jgi:heme oxygenase
MTHTDGSFLDDLRVRTQPSHKALEALPLSAVLLDPGITREQYIAYLQAMYGIVSEVEETVFPLVADILPDLSQRRKAHLLEQDLSSLGASVHKSYPLKVSGLVIDTDAAMGIMYVMEGSTLGGRVILKSIEKSLGLTAESGASYFAGYNVATGPLWKSFLDKLVAYEQDGNDRNAIISAASLTFDTIHRLMEQKTVGTE